jgi:hypothetical protein
MYQCEPHSEELPQSLLCPLNLKRAVWSTGKSTFLLFLKSRGLLVAEGSNYSDMLFAYIFVVSEEDRNFNLIEIF